MSDPLLVLALGNVLCGDDGAGVAALSRLCARYAIDARARLLDGGTLGLSLLGYLQMAESAILLDAVLADAPAGSLVRLEGDEVGPAVAQRLSPHQVGVADLLDGARLLGGNPQRIVLLGVVPERIELGIGFSPAVSAALDGLVEAAASEIASFGLTVRRGGEDAQRDPDDLHRVLGVQGG
jgi:hydrogenase maturation protease